MTFRTVLADVANRALAVLGSDDRRSVYTSLRELAGNPEPRHGNVGRLHAGWLRVTYEISAEPNEDGTTTITVWKIGTVA
ncbi:mRNA-degrading endonuclease RelE of RelBE toxin-antitoxin system [Catenulispora sp. MAP12-49]|uniref:type II toxin-antitoxin system RelE family toxin n=1 Tax=Catenulispora sp. MAP12-49 TaxID=3156302 RepID=UPI0035193788